jgi:hypothetical protein
LQYDRTLIYRFAPDWSGIVAAESVQHSRWSLMDRVVRDICFEACWIEPYQAGRYAAVTDTQTAD